MRNDDPLRRMLSGLAPPAPPPALRARALAAARRTRPEAVRRPDPWRRALESRGLRLAWAATALVLLVAHAVLTLPPPSSPLQAAWERELAAMADLPPIDPGALPSLDGPRTPSRRSPSNEI